MKAQEVLLAALSQTKSLFSAPLPVCTSPVQAGGMHHFCRTCRGSKDVLEQSRR